MVGVCHVPAVLSIMDAVEAQSMASCRIQVGIICITLIAALLRQATEPVTPLRPSGETPRPCLHAMPRAAGATGAILPALESPDALEARSVQAESTSGSSAGTALPGRLRTRHSRQGGVGRAHDPGNARLGRFQI